MATFGAQNTTNVGASFTGSGGRYYFFGGPSFPGGTVTKLELYGGNRAGNAAFNDFDIAIYEGGGTSTPDGATLAWNSKRYQGVTIGTGTAWHSIVDGSGAVPNVAVASGNLWIVMRSGDGINTNETPSSTEAADLSFNSSSLYYLVHANGDPGDAWSTPFPSGAGTDTSLNSLKVILTYTAGGASAIINKLAGPFGGPFHKLI